MLIPCLQPFVTLYQGAVLAVGPLVIRSRLEAWILCVVSDCATNGASVVTAHTEMKNSPKHHNIKVQIMIIILNNITHVLCSVK